MSAEGNGQKVESPTQEGVDGPPIARAHTLLAIALENAKRYINSPNQDRLSRIKPRFLSQLNSLISELRKEGDDWEDEWPK